MSEVDQKSRQEATSSSKVEGQRQEGLSHEVGAGTRVVLSTTAACRKATEAVRLIMWAGFGLPSCHGLEEKWPSQGDVLEHMVPNLMVPKHGT